jgi:hypothetical protein
MYVAADYVTSAALHMLKVGKKGGEIGKFWSKKHFCRSKLTYTQITS